MWNDLTMSERADVIKMAVKAGLRDMKSIRDFYDNSLKYAEGGPKPRTTKPKQAPWYSELDEAVLGEVMQQFRNIVHPANIEHASYKTDVRGKKGGTAQRTYLLPRFEQEDIFLRDGYIKGKEGDYGLVKKAVNNRNLPVWQTKPDAISRETLVPIGNAYGIDSHGYINRDKDLVHAESHPAAFYVDGSTGKLYTKGWDLNDYGGTGGGQSSKYNILKKASANILDFIGSPVVVTTGFQEVTNPWGGPSEHLNRGATIQDLFEYDDEGDPIVSNLGKLLDTTMNKQGLHRENIDGKWVYSLPEVTVYGNKKAKGGSIHISPSKRGTFTTAATKHGMGVQEFASKVLANKDNYSSAMVKKANFARNFGGHKHALGGYLFEEGGPKNTNREYKSANSWSTANINKALRSITEPLSKSIMNMGRSSVFDGDLSPNSELNYGIPQDTYLLPRNIQKDIFLEKGYTEVPNDYGLVKKAVGNRNIPVYQRRPDDITRDKVIPIGNINNNWEGNKEAELENPGTYPTAIYYSPETSKYYQKGWDLNDYGGEGQAYNSIYGSLERLQADLIDKIGSPVVTTTGISEIGNTNKIIKNPLLRTKVEDFLKTKGLVLTDVSRPLSEEERKWAELGLLSYNPNGDYVPSLPEITIIGKRKRKVK